MRLSRLSDHEILDLRICDLPGLKAGVRTPRLSPFVDGLYVELRAAGCRYFRPEVYLGDEWFSPDGVPKIAVPFYLTHPRLAALEKSMMHEIEGGTPSHLKKLLRHEAGHSFDHAYNLFRGRIGRSKEWRRHFGTPPRRYNPDVFVPDPMSRDFVRHLPGLYAQAHPEEDFAETFAVVLTPGLDWRHRYATWPKALAKLSFTAALVRDLGKTKPAVASGPDCYVAQRMRRTLASHYARRLNAVACQQAAVKKLTRRAQLSKTASAP